MVDSEGTIVYLNKRAEEILGIKKAEALKRTYDSSKWEITDKDGKKISSKKLPFAIIKKSKRSLKDFKHYIKIGNSQKRLLIISGVPIMNRKKFEGVVFMLEESDEK